MDSVWDDKSDRFRDYAGSWVYRSVHGKCHFKGKYRERYCNKCGVCSLAVQKCMNRQ